MIEISEVRNLRGELDLRPTRTAPGIGDPYMGALYNGTNGLRNWRYSWARIAPGLGGTDVVVLGDSIFGGAFGSSYLYDNMWHRTKVKLQNKLNAPHGIQGGYGYIPLILNGGTWTRSDDPVGSESNWVWTPSNEASWTVNAGGTGYHIGMRRAFHATNGANSRARFVMDGSAAGAAAKKMQCTDIELITSMFSGDATLTWDKLTSDAFVNVGSGAGGVTGTIVGNGAADFSIHRTRQLSGLTKTDVNGIQVGVASGTANCRPDGAFFYCEDWDGGARLQNLAINGARADYVTTSANTLSACISKMGATAPGGTPAGATQAGLFVLGFYLNDVGLNAVPTITLEDFIANYTAMITAAIACPSLPSVLIVIPQVRNDADTIANYRPYVQALYTLVDAYSDRCALLDLNIYFNNSNYTGTVTSFGLAHGDNTHYNDRGQECHSDLFFRVLTN
jgi:hypothetical protein